MKTDILAEQASLLQHYAKGLDHLQGSPKLLASATKSRDSLFELVRIDGAYYPLAWAKQFEDKLDKPLGESTLADIAGVIDSERAAAVFFPAGIAYSDLDEWRKQHGQSYRVFTGTVDYCATGEGNTLIFAASRAYTEGDFLLWLAGKVSYWYTIGARVYEGLPDSNDSTANYFLTNQLQKTLQTEIGAGPNQGGHIEFLLQAYVNYS